MGWSEIFFMDPWSYGVANKYRSHNHHYQQRNLLYRLYGLDLVAQRAKVYGCLNDIEKKFSMIMQS